MISVTKYPQCLCVYRTYVFLRHALIALGTFRPLIFDPLLDATETGKDEACNKDIRNDSQKINLFYWSHEQYISHYTRNITCSGLDIGYVPAGSHAFLRLSGQFGPLQLIFPWPLGPVDFFFFFFFSASYAAIIFTGNRQNSEGNVNSYLFFRYI